MTFAAEEDLIELSHLDVLFFLHCFTFFTFFFFSNKLVKENGFQDNQNAEKVRWKLLKFTVGLKKQRGIYLIIKTGKRYWGIYKHFPKIIFSPCYFLLYFSALLKNYCDFWNFSAENIFSSATRAVEVKILTPRRCFNFTLKTNMVSV